MTFDDITSKVRQISMDTVAEVQKMNEVRQLNSNINAEKKKIHSMYAEMGKKLYDKYRENPLEEFESEFAALKAEFENIEALRGQVRAKKGVTLCPNCKMEVGEFERFCSNCGCKMPEVFTIVEDEPAGALETDESNAQVSQESVSSEEDAPSETVETETSDTVEADESEALEEAEADETEALEEAEADETEALEEAEAGETEKSDEIEEDKTNTDAAPKMETIESETSPEEPDKVG
ncbi:MAG: hypothetical protein LUD12_07070 [Lachnospiraceae bacterium]|nr:hypothetical protein [Lachnospiraceae bacterium]